MIVTPIKTPIVHPHDDLYEILAANLPRLQEKSVIAITSKIVALCEGAVVPIKPEDTKEDKHELVKKQAEYYLDSHSSKYNLMLTIRDHVLAVNAGVDESNANGYYVLWPQHPQQTANQIWQWLRQKFQLKQVGVILTDSKTFPLKWGVMGTTLSHCGFSALNNLIGKPDLFGREMLMTQVNVAEGLGAAAVLEMGETAESTPLAIISDITSIQFQDREPTREELDNLTNNLDDDVFAPILKSADWQRGGAESDPRLKK